MLVVLAGAGGGLPMCLTVLSQTLTPCEMHEQHDSHGDHHERRSSSDVRAFAAPVDCHHAPANSDCGSNGLCPSGGPALSMSASADAPAGVMLARSTELQLTPHSFLAPPPSPPPLA
jgi:hypothetical protein